MTESDKLADHAVPRSGNTQTAKNSTTTAEPRRPIATLSWLTLTAILALYAFCALRVNPVATFGTYEDDTLYFSYAKAIAAGEGYMLPSLPIQLHQTKYPELFPLLLSLVWRLEPSFPANLSIAVALTLLFGCASLLFIFLIARNWPGLGDGPALATTALCAFTAYFLYLSASVMSDIPFCALILGATWLGTRCQERRATAGLSILAGALAGLSIGIRSLGLASVAGIGLFLILKRRRRELLWFAASALPLAGVSLWPAARAALTQQHSTLLANPLQSGWSQTVCYYSSYACAWHLGVNDAAALRAVVLKNLQVVLQQPGTFLMYPLAVGPGLRSLILVTLLGVGSYVGLARSWRENGPHPLTLIFAFYLPLVIPWPYTPDRFLLVFAPLFFLGLWTEGGHLTSAVSQGRKRSQDFAQRALAVALALAGMGLAAVILANYVWAIPTEAARVRAGREQLLADKLGAFQWIRQHTPPKVCVIASEDGLLYLYTGRHSIMPIAGLPQSFYQDSPQYAERDAAHLADVALSVHASYWLSSPEDFTMLSPLALQLLSARQKILLANSPIAYRSPDGKVALYDIRGLTRDAPGGLAHLP